MLTEIRIKELNAEFKKLGIAKIRARLANKRPYNIWETPYVQGLIEDYSSKRIKPIDIIMAIAAFLSIAVAIIFGQQNKQLQNNKQVIHNEAQVVQQFITNNLNNYNFPSEVVKAIDVIRAVSGDTVTVMSPEDTK